MPSQRVNGGEHGTTAHYIQLNRHTFDLDMASQGKTQVGIAGEDAPAK